MQLVTFDAGSGPRLGALAGSKVVDVARAADASGKGSLPSDMRSLIEGGQSTWDLARDIVGWAKDQSGDFLHDESSVGLKAPLSNPSKIVCVGFNYKEHADEKKLEMPEEPIFFNKFPDVIIGPGEAIQIPRLSEQADYEIELAVVIGHRGRQISQAEAYDHVFGYTIMNDVSCREYQYKFSQWLVGKNFDTFAPMGPAIVTADEISDPQNLGLRLSINGEVLQDSNTSNMAFKIPKLIEFASSFFTLQPGDIFMTGTPSGVGVGRSPERWMRPGETVVLEIEGLGRLSNPVVAE